ncbi:HigA family addiction module antitoxin [Chromobacterium haemolyticum]|nr:HigA family addiction module antitoxin [Chromobacterium haemolyticum]
MKLLIIIDRMKGRGASPGYNLERIHMEREIPLAHPGEILELEFLNENGITPYALAKAIDVPATRISKIIHGERSITPDTALRLGRYFDMDPQFWLNLQAHYDLENARQEISSMLEKIKPLKAA